MQLSLRAVRLIMMVAQVRELANSLGLYCMLSQSSLSWTIIAPGRKCSATGAQALQRPSDNRIWERDRVAAVGAGQLVRMHTPQRALIFEGGFMFGGHSSCSWWSQLCQILVLVGGYPVALVGVWFLCLAEESPTCLLM